MTVLAGVCHDCQMGRVRNLTKQESGLRQVRSQDRSVQRTARDHVMVKASRVWKLVAKEQNAVRLAET